MYNTLTHQPPEELLGGDMSIAGDIYAFGVLLWQVGRWTRCFTFIPQPLEYPQFLCNLSTAVLQLHALAGQEPFRHHRGRHDPRQGQALLPCGGTPILRGTRSFMHVI